MTEHTLGRDCPCGPQVEFVPGRLLGVALDVDTARDLSRAAKNVTTWTQKRNTLIRAAHESGGGVREIARATGLNPATVHNILKPKRSRRRD